jgi:hypothetical protein
MTLNFSPCFLSTSFREKACTFFTLLLLNFSACNWGQFGSFSDQDFLFCLDSFAKDVFAGMSISSDIDML